MSDKPNVWIVKDGEGWAVKREGAGRASSRHDTQKEALDAGRPAAIRDQVELLWQGKDGKIKGRNSHGNDPHPPKG